MNIDVTKSRGFRMFMVFIISVAIFIIGISTNEFMLKAICVALVFVGWGVYMHFGWSK